MDESVRELSEGETSDDGLKIAFQSPKRKTPKKKVYDILDKAIIESMESDLDNILDEKASKSNLTAINVKSILKEVMKNEHVIALVRRAEDPNTSAGSMFEPKLTRAKVKELFSTAPVQSHPLLMTTTPPSEVQRLISNEFAEDSSGDEYIPAEESEDDRESSVVSESDVRSVSPVTPIKHIDSPIHWTDDGIFKIPPVKITEEKTEDATVALRTRSKLSLNDIPLEEIEGAFMPPDITPDMYEMECDNDLWSDFLRMLSTKPLDEVTKGTEDDDHDEHDPSYNILADEAINLVDTEDFRADKAVNVPRKELNELIAGLCDYVNDDESKSEPRINLNVQPQVVVLENLNVHLVEEVQNLENNAAINMSVIEPSSDVDLNEVFRSNQISLLKQQMRQHVQLLTQHFLLSYHHPEFNHLALEFKEYLLNLKCKVVATDNENSAFKVCNLESALELIAEWELQLNLNTDDVKKMKEHVARVTEESKQYHASGNQYIPKLSSLILETISKSTVFIYPHLLPKIPFKTPSTLGKSAPFSPQEDQLIALGMEQFIPYLAKDKFHINKKGEVKLKHVCSLICQYMISTKNVDKLYYHIHNIKHPRNPMNPIRYYVENQKAPSTLHYVISMEKFGIIPPNRRDKNQLPYQFQQYLYPEPKVVNSITKVVKPPAFNKRFTKSPSRARRKSLEPSSCGANSGSKEVLTFKKPIYSSTPKPKVVARKLEQYFRSPNLKRFNQTDNSCLKCLKFNSSIFKKITDSTMLPSMPNLVLSCNESVDEVLTLNSTQEDVSTITTTKASETVEVEDEEVAEKDNEDDINALMAASSNIKNLGRKSISGAEKRRAKLRRQCTATLTMLSVQDPTVIEEKEQSYAQAYFDKAQERLAPEEYEQVLELFNNFQEGTNSVVELYKNMETILGKTNPDLVEEFLTFLTPAQAKEVGKLIPYYMLSNMSLFLRKLETYFKEQPSQLRKIYRSLIELTNCVNVTMDRVKNTILPLLKGNNLLTDWFLQIFPTEPPPESLLQGHWEQVNILRGVDTNQEDCFETITIPDVEDQYGGLSCICSCHQTEDIKSRSQHCIPCGMKFLQGRVYVQTRKGLRSANVTFDSNSEIDHNLRLNCSPDKKKRRADTSPSKQQISPPKEYQEEVRVTVDSEDDECIRKKARSRSPRKKKVKLTDKNEKVVTEFIENQEGVTEAEIATDLKSFPNNLDDTIIPETSADITEEIEQWEFNTSVESTELRAGSEHGTESESEFCEESSQDNINTETDESESESLSNSPIHSDNSNSNNTFEHISWNREEDRIILETLQKEGDREDTFLRISELLENRTVSQIRERFNTLMSLLQKMKSLNK